MSEVWILTYWNEDDDWIEGVYATAEAAMAERPRDLWLEMIPGQVWSTLVGNSGYEVRIWEVLGGPEHESA